VKIAYVTAGAAGMYCGSCLHDNTLAAALIRQGHDVALIPTYTPIRTDADDVSIDRVFYGAINVFLEQKSALFRHTPWLVDRMLNGPRLLDWASKRGASVDARGLGEMTLSVLEGEEGKQSKELDRLVEWLQEFRPEIVQLTNSMFLGTARRIRAALGVPVVCSVQGEDIFLEELEEPHRTQVHEALRRRAADVDAFVAPSRYYVDYMSDYLAIPPERIHEVRLGVNLQGFEGDVERSERPFVIGYLARICPEKGLHLLVEAFRRLVDETGREQVRLRIAGYLGERDRPYLEGILEQIQSWGLDGSVDHVGEVDRREKIDFLRTLNALSVPTTYREPKGLFVLEALAAATPVVLPDHGAFPEMLEATEGGVLVEPGSAPALVEAFRRLMDDPQRCDEMGRRGREAVQRDYNDAVTAERSLEIYRGLIAAAGARGGAEVRARSGDA
jgi:glycosyltransferase involved in cell wall biosynthesis